MNVVVSIARLTVTASAIAIATSAATAAQFHWQAAAPAQPAASDVAIWSTIRSTIRGTIQGGIRGAILQAPMLREAVTPTPELFYYGASAALPDILGEVDGSTPALAAASAPPSAENPSVFARGGQSGADGSPWGEIADEPGPGSLNPDGSGSHPIVPIPMPIYLAAAGLCGAALLRRRLAR